MAWVQSVVWELRSCKPLGVAKKKGEKADKKIEYPLLVEELLRPRDGILCKYQILSFVVKEFMAPFFFYCPILQLRQLRLREAECPEAGPGISSGSFK